MEEKAEERKERNGDDLKYEIEGGDQRERERRRAVKGI